MELSKMSVEYFFEGEFEVTGNIFLSDYRWTVRAAMSRRSEQTKWLPQTRRQSGEDKELRRESAKRSGSGLFAASIPSLENWKRVGSRWRQVPGAFVARLNYRSEAGRGEGQSERLAHSDSTGRQKETSAVESTPDATDHRRNRRETSQLSGNSQNG